MTDQRDSVTAAELDELEKRLEAQRDFGLVGTPYPVASYSDALDAIRALRRELADARERHAISQSVTGDMASALDDARADIAKKDAALARANTILREREEVWWEDYDVIADLREALAPAAQGEDRTHAKIASVAPAPAISGEWKSVVDQAYRYLRDHDPADAVSAMWRNEIVSAMEVLAAAPTIGEPT